MKAFYVMGPQASGKTTLCLGLALHLQSKGLKTGYWKPVGSSAHSTRKEDEDALLFHQVLNLPYTMEDIAPLNIGTHYLSGLRKKEQYRQSICTAYEKIAKHQLDVLLVGGATAPYVLSSHELDDISLAVELQIPALIVIHVKSDYSVDQALLLNRYLKLNGVEVLGNIFNNISRPLLDKVRGIHQPLLEQQGCRVLGVIPASPEITFPTAREFLSVLSGELLTGEEYLDHRVDEIVVGSMTIEGALKYLRRAPNKAFIIGGDRNDLALTALETNTSVLILTGGLYPNVKVIAQAEEKKVPVILVHHDTFTTIEQLHTLSQRRRIRPEDKAIIKLAQQNVENYCDCKPLWQYLNPAGDKD